MKPNRGLPHPVLLFDGECNLCSFAVVFTIRRDKQGKLRYAALQSDAGKVLLVKFNLSLDQMDSFVFIEGGRCFLQSTAALRVARQLDGLWPVFYGFIIIPKPIRDLVYNFIAKRRHQWFGRKEACMVPTKEMQQRFL